MASSSKHQNISVDEKAFTHLYENLLYPWTFYVLKNADFDKAITFSNSRVSYKLSAEDYSVEHWFNPIKKGEYSIPLTRNSVQSHNSVHFLSFTCLMSLIKDSRN